MIFRILLLSVLTLSVGCQNLQRHATASKYERSSEKALVIVSIKVNSYSPRAKGKVFFHEKLPGPVTRDRYNEAPYFDSVSKVSNHNNGVSMVDNKANIAGLYELTPGLYELTNWHVITTQEEGRNNVTYLQYLKRPIISPKFELEAGKVYYLGQFTFNQDKMLVDEGLIVDTYEPWDITVNHTMNNYKRDVKIAKDKNSSISEVKTVHKINFPNLNKKLNAEQERMVSSHQKPVVVPIFIY